MDMNSGKDTLKHIQEARRLLEEVRAEIIKAIDTDGDPAVQILVVDAWCRTEILAHALEQIESLIKTR